ncbi:MAG TPA: hypothetical protein PLG41_12155, partial [Leptospiraceae bacterium]|nr:hypothetical protein [Leptospiraceae bacterium]
MRGAYELVKENFKERIVFFSQLRLLKIIPIIYFFNLIFHLSSRFLCHTANIIMTEDAIM